ncbi:hypothetical protein ON010_g13785 [Phytophthora cinnamomi]|nr:hypothetical protein ON010_g13785 [Phytophthora cinnamomi]
MESHLYERVQPSEFYNKLANVLETQKSAYKVNVALGYYLVSKTDDSETRYFHPNLGNTYVFDKPVAINSRSDVRKVISEIPSMGLADKLNYPSSGYRLKAITGFKIYLYQREHALGDSELVIPKIIRDNKSVINFPKTNNKCVFHCISYHKREDPKKDPRKVQALIKQAFKQYCAFKGISFTLSLYRNFKPIDILEFDELEDCFKLSINVYTMDIECGNVECIRRSEKRTCFNANINVRSVIWCLPALTSSAITPKNQCELVNIESFPAEPSIYRPAQNTIRSMLTKYSIKNVDQYIDHFIVYDFEAILKPTATQHGENTTVTNEHIPVSVSVADSLSEEVRCFVSDDPKELLKDMFQYIATVGEKIQRYNVSKYAGAVIMYLIAKRSKKKYGIDDERQALYTALDSWVEAIGEKRPFLGGEEPNMADLSVFGVLRAMHGLDTYNDMMRETNIEPWFMRMTAKVGPTSRTASN